MFIRIQSPAGPVDVNTLLIERVTYFPGETATLHFQDGGRMSVTLNEAARITLLETPKK